MIASCGAQQKERDTCLGYAEVQNIRKPCASRPPSRPDTGCTNVHGVGENPLYGVPRHWVARGSPGGSA